MAIFGGVGEVAREIDDFRADGVHGSAGFGLRILLSAKEQVHLRADWGFGGDGGFYLGIGEVF